MGDQALSGTQASTVAGQIDLLFLGITGVAVFFTIAIFVAITFMAIKYRRGAKVDRSRPPSYNHLIEFVWTVIPLGIAMGLFVWAAALYFQQSRVPAGAMEIHVVGKQWMWKMQQPNGRWENNELHVPVGRPIVLTMTSEDVIHSFYVPAFRLKQDVVPGQFTKMWFQPTTPGTYHLWCAEFCGTLHSQMIGSVTVMEPGDYERWLAEGTTSESAAALGERLFRRHGCSGCHNPSSSVHAPLLEGKFGRQIPVQTPKAGVPLDQVQAETITMDERYIHDAIVLPEKEVAAGYKPIMPSYKNRLTEQEILQIVHYIKTLGQPANRGSNQRERTNSLTREDYEARTGFVPANLNRIQSTPVTGNAAKAAAGASAGGTGAAPAPAGGGAGASGTGSAPAEHGGAAGSTGAHGATGTGAGAHGGDVTGSSERMTR